METTNRLLDQLSTNRLADKPLANGWPDLTNPDVGSYYKEIYEQWSGELDKEQTDKRKHI
ncbi:hypothetical protein Rin_00002710 [Candidatus Regiella insecticola 5.15]|uniref:Uncharacterized protein n=1 Tax=Candidatus Regiella insecticola 5.15 TaxID=1005043 RepID=G2GWY4_9ENTR|nr:hypothetical protein [Candidatus Regiella insecticola]EGY29768.1 hypothetical protein Rin_00002710 [Candidatus Regiella insecticola 5.15]